MYVDGQFKYGAIIIAICDQKYHEILILLIYTKIDIYLQMIPHCPVASTRYESSVKLKLHFVLPFLRFPKYFQILDDLRFTSAMINAQIELTPEIKKYVN